MTRTAVTTVAEFQELIRTIYSPAEADFIGQAALCAAELHQRQVRASGEPYIIHPLQVAQILMELRMDATTIAAALLHDTLEDTSLSRDDLRTRFGKDVETLVFGVTKIEIVNERKKNFAEAETIRKMLFAMVKDVRVILIKLADRLHNMRTLQWKTPDRQKVIAQDTLDIYAPLAARLGISWVKDELEDLALKYLQPEVYQQIKSFVAQKKYERGDYLARVKQAIEAAATSEGIVIDVESRAKHFYSIYTKLKKRNKQLEEIYDLLGIRIICDQIHDCYIVLGMVHRLWMPIEGRFKDYIAMPKSNRYQSLHTTVMCYDGKLIEIQIRTRDMDETAEFGVAAHWLYKQRNPQSTRARPEDISLISRLADMNASGLASTDFLEEIKRDLLKDSIYVFTPRGDVIQLSSGATAIDFAYHIHTEVGNHAVAAKADGQIIPLRTALKNTQVIEIITNPHGRPHVDWLRHAHSSRTRHKIRAWLNHHDETIFVDRNIVARKPKTIPEPAIPAPVPPPRTPAAVPPGSEGKPAPIRVEGQANMVIRLASCCLPATGDDIIGYVSRGRGIIVHRRDCRNLKGIPDLNERGIEVEWETVAPHVERRLTVQARRTVKLFPEIDAILRRFGGSLLQGRVDTDDPGELVEGHFAIRLERRESLKRFLKALRQIDGIIDVQDQAHAADLS